MVWFMSVLMNEMCGLYIELKQKQYYKSNEITGICSFVFWSYKHLQIHGNLIPNQILIQIFVIE